MNLTAGVSYTVLITANTTSASNGSKVCLMFDDYESGLINSTGILKSTITTTQVNTTGGYYGKYLYVVSSGASYLKWIESSINMTDMVISYQFNNLYKSNYQGICTSLACGTIDTDMIQKFQPNYNADTNLYYKDTTKSV